MKWFTPTIQDEFENVWTRQESGLPYWDHGDPSAVQFIRGNKPVLIQPSFVLIKYPVFAEDVSAYKETMFSFLYTCRNAIYDQLVWYKPGAFARATRIMQLFQTKWNGPALASNHAEMGWLLGYPVEEIEAFVQSGISCGHYEDR